ncbi:pyruvate kinase [Candidatus Oleimmundimicrobium sp.]|uniref:pyruvate kinase n=1 Tax=Candidatus Oleimmundimicrobium sp. TaxID=3060597 RepID=UPI0027248174|nr:pyruvate kinase [Candidatus Oleimmundimicrobium sp.]MDO8886293.1 pyruvate kinase [Candidatus Oleimmundimicrobium sp.]
MRRTKIVCTIGPASEDVKTLKELISAGMNVARLNLSHGSHKEHARNISIIRKISNDLGIPIGIILDLSGPKLRVGEISGDSVNLEPGHDFTLTTLPMRGDKFKVFVNFSELPNDVSPGDTIFLNDGLIELKVKFIKENEVVTKVIGGGKLSSHNGINLPNISISIDSITEKDVEDLSFGLKHEVDWVAMSFVRSSDDIKKLRLLMHDFGKEVPIIAKIEKHEAARRINEIIDVADGIMVARGDLGVEMFPEEVPIIQKKIIAKAIKKNKPVIIATQMLNSMIENQRPTRAEVSDVANAIFDETDAVMLSGETAIGNYPVKSVKMMTRIIEKTESYIDYVDELGNKRKWAQKNVTDAISFAACELASALKAKVIVTSTQSGNTARRVSKYRSAEQIVAVTPEDRTVKQLTLSWGVAPLHITPGRNTDEMIEKAVNKVVKAGFVKKGDDIIITAGVIVNIPGTTNLIKVHKV